MSLDAGQLILSSAYISSVSYPKTISTIYIQYNLSIIQRLTEATHHTATEIQHVYNIQF